MRPDDGDPFNAGWNAAIAHLSAGRGVGEDALRSDVAALVKAADEALRAIDIVMPAHRGQAEYNDLKHAFDNLEDALSRYAGQEEK